MAKTKLERMNLSKYLKTKYKDVKDVDPSDVDDVATAKDIASADKNIMIQLKKQIGLGNAFKVEFGDKKKTRVPDKIAKAAIELYDKHKTSQQKGDYQNTISKSYKDLLSFIRKGKPVAMEAVVIQEPLDPEKHDVKKYISDFQKSTNPQFDGMSQEKRKEMAIAAYTKAKENKEDMSLAPKGKGRKAAKALYKEEETLDENFRTLATKGMGTETKKQAKVGQESDFYEPKLGDKFFGKIIKMDNKGYQVRGLDRQFKGKIFTFKYYDKNKAKNLLKQEEKTLDETNWSAVVAKTGAERLGLVKKLYPFVDDITNKKKKDKVVQGFYHYIKNKDKIGIKKLDKIVSKLGKQRAMDYIDQYRQNYLRMDTELDEKVGPKDKVFLKFPNKAELTKALKYIKTKFRGGIGHNPSDKIPKHVQMLVSLQQIDMFSGIKTKKEFLDWLDKGKFKYKISFTDKFKEEVELDENFIVEDNVATLKNIVKGKRAMPLKFKDGTMKVDLQTASGLLKSIILLKTKPETLKKLTSIIDKGSKSQFLRLVDLMWK